MKKLKIFITISFALVMNSNAQQPVTIPGTPGMLPGPAGYIKDVHQMELSPENIRFHGEPKIVEQFYDEAEKVEEAEHGNYEPAMEHPYEESNPMHSTAKIKYIDENSGVTSPPEQPAGEKITSQHPAYTGLGNQQNGWDPSDAEMATGPNHIIVMSNGDVRILNKQNGTIISQVTMAAFFSWSGFVFDPRIYYDPFGQKWVALGLKDANQNCTGVDSKFRVLISNNSDPTQGWYWYEIDFDASNQAWFDFAMLGFNKDWICVAGHSLCTNVPAIYVFNKPQAYAAASVSYYWWNALGNAAPAFTYDNSLARLYLTKSGNPNSGGTGYLDTWYIDSAPNLTQGYSYGTSPWQAFASDSANCPKQLGGVSTFTAVNIFGHGMLSNSVYRNGYLWCVHPIFLPATGSTNRVSTQWWAVDPVSGSISQVGRIDDGTGATSEFYQSIGVNKNSDALISYSIYNASWYPSGAYNFRNAADPSNLVPTGVFYWSGGSNDPDGRGGDYSQCALDPLDDESIWLVNQVTAGGGGWETRFTLVPGYYGCYTIATFGNFPWYGNTKNEASVSITSAEMIQPYSMVDYDAGSYVVLTTGFNAMEGSIFTAYIDGCGGASPIKPKSGNVLTSAEPVSRNTEEPEAAMQLSIYPNPSSGLFTLHFVTTDVDANMSIRIFNSEMNLVSVVSENISVAKGTYNRQLDLSHLPSGLYFCRVETNEKVFMQKLQVAR